MLQQRGKVRHSPDCFVVNVQPLKHLVRTMIEWDHGEYELTCVYTPAGAHCMEGLFRTLFNQKMSHIIRIFYMSVSRLK